MLMLPDPIYPPRPRSRLLWTHLPRYEATGLWLVQYKFNGKYVVIWVDTASREVGVWGRETEPLVRFKPGPWLYDQFLSLNFEQGKQYWLCGELLHQKTKDSHYQNRIVLFDVVQAGRMLIGPKAPDQMGRLALLADVCRHPTKHEPRHGIALGVTENIWMAESFLTGFTDHYKRFLPHREIEGVVLKRRAAKLRQTGDEYYEISDWIRVRKPSASYTH